MSATVIGDYGVGPSGGSPLLVDLTAYWKMDDATDSVGANDLSNNNGVSFASAGKLGNCATFVATSNQSLSILDNDDLSVGDEDFSISLWVRFDTSISSGNETLLSKWVASPSEYEIYREGTGLKFNVGGSGDKRLDTAGMSVGTWYHIVAVYDAAANTLQMWRNNADPGAAITWSGGTTDDNATFEIGHGPAWGYLNGAIDEVGFWKRAFTADDRAALYNGGTGITYPFS